MFYYKNILFSLQLFFISTFICIRKIYHYFSLSCPNNNVSSPLHLCQLHHTAPSLAFRAIMQLFTFSLPLRTRQAYLLTSVSLLLSRHAFPTQSLTECTPFLRTYRIPPLHSGSTLTQALLCSPCPTAATSPFPANLHFLKFFFSVR